MSAAAPTKKRVAILISGRGSNMVSLIEAARAPDYPAEIIAVISNRPEAEGLAKARAHGIHAAAIDHTASASREAFEGELHKALLDCKADLACCAGFMRMFTPSFVEKWLDRMLNIHPSLLPAFKGLHTHERALAAGVKIAGCTVHLVRATVDDGPVIAQAAVPVLTGDTTETLSARVLAAEHRLYPHALRLWATGEAKIVDKKVVVHQTINQAASLFSPAL